MRGQGWTGHELRCHATASCVCAQHMVTGCVRLSPGPTAHGCIGIVAHPHSTERWCSWLMTLLVRTPYGRTRTATLHCACHEFRMEEGYLFLYVEGSTPTPFKLLGTAAHGSYGSSWSCAVWVNLASASRVRAAASPPSERVLNLMSTRLEHGP